MQLTTEFTVKQIVVPQHLRSHLLKVAHSNRWSGHLGKTKTLERLQQHFYWPGMCRQVDDAIKVCDTLSKTRQKSHSA